MTSRAKSRRWRSRSNEERDGGVEARAARRERGFGRETVCERASWCRPVEEETTRTSGAAGQDVWVTRRGEQMLECGRGWESRAADDSVWAVWGPLGQGKLFGGVAVSGDVALGKDGGELGGSSSSAGRRAGSFASQMGLAGTTAGPKRRQFV